MRQHDEAPAADPAASKLSRQRELYVDAASGIAGDMLLAACFDLGVPEDEVIGPLRTVLPPFEVSVPLTRRRGLQCRQLRVRGLEAEPPRRTLRDIQALLSGGSLSDRARQRTLAVFRELAIAEGKVHGVSPETVHFHEVGAVDSLFDITGTVLAFEHLEPFRITCSSLPLGSGTVQTEHGLLPVPAPATLELLRGLPTHALGAGREMTTPTGAALVRVLADAFGAPPSGRIERIGTGAGTREAPPDEPPNLLRIWTLTREPASAGEEVITVLETNVDTLTGEEIGHVLESLLEAGALEVFATPTLQKKSRPGYVITVLAGPGRESSLERKLFEESGTLGIRRRVSPRRVLSRDWTEIDLRGGTIRVKCAYLDGRQLVAAPEYEDLRRLAEETGVPLRQLRTEALDSLSRKTRMSPDE